MSIWPILALGVLTAFFGWRRDNVRRLFDPSRRKISATNNKDELVRSLDALIDFLSKHEEFKWVGILGGIRTDLQNQAAQADALSRLGAVFGGMGSVNDLIFNGAGADQEGGRLLDAVFRDMSLYYGTPEDRIQWKKLEDEHKGELPPRIKHAFRKE
jgi:hypothetical protein